jgi:hypothetical protein
MQLFSFIVWNFHRWPSGLGETAPVAMHALITLLCLQEGVPHLFCVVITYYQVLGNIN